MTASNSFAKKSETVRYVALGDSYTIGTGGTPQDSWPAVLTRHLHSRGIAIELTANLGRNGWTTRDVIAYQLPIFKSLNSTFATLLIGVNDWVQGADCATFQKNFKFLLDEILRKLPDKHRLLLVTLPDFSMMPVGNQFSDGRSISKGIDEFNAVIKQEARARGLAVVDINPFSKTMGTNLKLIASDGLHPSAQGYAQWEKLIFPEAEKILRK